MIAPQVGRVFLTEGGYKAVVTVDFLEKEKKVDSLGCRYGGYLIAPGGDQYRWWRPTGEDPRHPDSSLTDLYRAEHDPVYQPILEPHAGTPRAMANFYSRYEDIQREWGGRTKYANRLQRIDDGIIGHVVEL